MRLHFSKYEGAGNDFILIDNRKHLVNHQQPQLISKLCDRRFGIGADGIIFLQNKKGFDFEMIYYNADGQSSSMCGNGGRCAVAFAKKLGIIHYQTTFYAVDIDTNELTTRINQGPTTISFIDCCICLNE